MHYYDPPNIPEKWRWNTGNVNKRKRRQKTGDLLAQGHRASSRQSQDLNPGSVTSELTL